MYAKFFYLNWSTGYFVLSFICFATLTIESRAYNFFFLKIPIKNYKYFYLKRLKIVFFSFLVSSFRVFNKILYNFEVFLIAD